MAGASAAFSEMPVEFQRVLDVAAERHGISVTPLDRLVGGWSGASIHLVSVQGRESGRPEHCVLKLDRKRPSARSGEADRHAAALAAAPAAFARTHMADMVFEPVEHDGAVAIFYRIAGQSLQRFRPLGSYQRQSQLSGMFAAVTTGLLDEWNPNRVFRQLEPAELLRTWLAFRLKPDGHLDAFLRDACRVDPGVPGFLVGGSVLRNPLAYARDPERWAAARPIDAMIGSQHGDLNTNNVLVRLDEGGDAVDGYYLIDFAAFQPGMPLLYDQRYLEMSYLVLAMARVPFASAAALITRLAEADVPDPYRAPVETAGPTAVLAAARQAFGAWVQERHPSLHDDLWAQYWLAGVAAGLAYCHKPGLGDEPRLAGLLYAAANLERYAAAFPLPAPTEVRMLVGEGPPGGAPAPATSDREAPLDLPAQVTPFLGREAELAQGRALLLAEEVRLLTLLGPGGIGKTRLALQLAADTGRDFSDGAVFVDLAAAHEPEEVLAAVARAIGLRTAGDRPLLETVPEHLGDRRMLLVLDNFEQAVSAAPAVAELLRACPHVTLLVTSREALHLRGERLLPVPALPLPEGGSGALTAQDAGRFEAVRFFVERATAVRPDFRLTDDNAAAVAEICRRLDGLPLALELAAARTSLLPPQALLERLSRPLAVLRGGARDLPARQQTLRDAIAWSHGLLDADEQRLFALLSVFSGGSLAAVEAVARAVGLADRIDVLDGVTSLVDKSLLRPLDPSAPVPCVGMLQTIRDYATERLDAQPEQAAAVRRAHAVYYADMVRDHVQRLSGPERKAALRELEADVDDLRTAWQHWVAAGDLERLRTMTLGLWALYDERGWYSATAALTTDLLHVLETTPSTPERSQEEILLQTSLARVLLATKGYTQEVEAAYARAIELCEAYGHQAELLPALRGLANLYAFVTDFEKGARVGEQILALAEERDDPAMRVEGHFVVASCVFGVDPKGGLDHLDRALAEYDPDRYPPRRYHLGNDPGVPCLTTSALLLWMLGYPDRARERADRAIALAQRLDHPYSAAYAAFHMGLLHLWLGEPSGAERLAAEGLRIATAQGFEIWRALALCLQGAALAEQGRAAEGLTLVERGVGQYGRLRTPPVFWPLLQFVRARVSMQAGRLEHAMSLLDDALAIVEPSPVDPQAGEMFRMKGELLLATSPDRAEEAERWFQRALQLARDRDVRTMELRAATSLARLWRTQGRQEDSRRLVEEALDRLPEGRNTGDAREASALLG